MSETGPIIRPDHIDSTVVEAFKGAWEARRQEISRGIGEYGTKTRAGLTAALEELGLAEFLEKYVEQSDGYSITPDMNAALEKIMSKLAIE